MQANLNAKQKKVICHLHCLDNKINCNQRKAANKETVNIKIYRTWAIPLKDMAFIVCHVQSAQGHTDALVKHCYSAHYAAPINLEYEVQLPLCLYIFSMHFMLVNCIQSRSCHKSFKFHKKHNLHV